MGQKNFGTYQPIQTEALPVKWNAVFFETEIIRSQPNDFDIVRTITGWNLKLVVSDPEAKVKRLAMPAGYQKAIWELREGHLRYCPADGRLWRRDADEEDHKGDRYILNSWHPIKTIEDEYGVENRAQTDLRISTTIEREAKREEWFAQVQRGLRVGKLIWTRKHGVVCHEIDEHDVAVTQNITDGGMSMSAVQKARAYAAWLTTSKESASNLLRMFATPFLEPFKQLTYVVSGHGGDGKTLIMQQAVLSVLGTRIVYPAFSAQSFCGAGSKYSLDKESMLDMMDGCAFAYDDEAGSVTESMLPELRGLSTGQQMRARVQSGRYRIVKPSATIVLLTNQSFADSSENSDRRRFAKIEMHASKGRTYDEYHAIELFCHAHPAAFFVASAMEWEEKGDEPYEVALSPARAISDEMYWLISEIVENEKTIGRLVASRSDYRQEFRSSVPDDTMKLLGLENSTAIGLRGNAKQQRVVRVKDLARFNAYRRMVEDQSDDDAIVEGDDVDSIAASMPGRDSLKALEAGSITAVAELVANVTDGQAGFAPVEGKKDAKTGKVEDKVSLSWRKFNPDREHLTGPDIVEDDWDKYCVPVGGRMIVIDCDADKTDSSRPHGFQYLQALTGKYGSADLPETLAVRSPHGLHLYYTLPLGIDVDTVKNAVKGGHLPIDLRVAGKGYVLGPGSRTKNGMYELVDVPDTRIPTATPAIMRFLNDHGFIEHKQASFTDVQDFGMQDGVKGFGGGNGRPDMTPIPEGSRNSDLHSWAYGRALNHRDNWPQIEADLMERGRVSGLPESECRTIWKSIMRQLDGAR